MEGKVASIKNVRAAKHRHESQSKPKGRFCLFMPAFVNVAEAMAISRDGQEQEDARSFLRFISED
eukprot:2254959-Lingulodinium_polyedra.AAC.1